LIRRLCYAITKSLLFKPLATFLKSTLAVVRSAILNLVI
jgi:hypothetical protein